MENTSAHHLLEAIALVLGVAAITTVLFQRLRQPVVLGYLLAGLLVGPYVAFPVFANPDIVHSLSELGVILLMFALGLEFRLGKLIELAPTAGLVALLQCILMTWLGFAVGRAFGWTVLESVFTGAVISISSTTIIAKAFDEQRVRGRVREFVVGILIVEDLIAVLMMAVLTAIATGSGLSAGALALTTGKLVAFLVGLVAIGILIVPRSMRAIVRLNRPETTLVASIGFCFAISLLAQAFGYSVALGAFIAGSLVAESGEEHAIEPLVVPVRDVFAAIFFVSVGMMIDPTLILANAGAVAALTLAVVVGSIVTVSLSAFLTGNGTRVSIQSGMSLAQIGEFSFIIAALGTSLGATRDFLYPVAVAVSAITTLTTPWLIRGSGPFASFVERMLPPPVQTFVALYGSWIERLRESPREPTRTASLRRVGLLLLVDTACIVAVIAVATLAREVASEFLATTLGLERGSAAMLIAIAALLLCTPFLAGIFRLARRLGAMLAQVAFPDSGALDLAAAPRRALRVAFELMVVLLVAFPVLVAIQPVVGGFAAAGVAVLITVAAGVAFWRTATDLAGHVRAGAQMVVEALVAQSAPGHRRPDAGLHEVEGLVPGLGHLVPVHIHAASPAVGKTLAELDLRGLTGATVLAIQRGKTGMSIPSARETLLEGDVLALAGSEESVDAAKSLLHAAARA
jgi:CPA2 family monovalent cation:H+ antiporter-2